MGDLVHMAHLLLYLLKRRWLYSRMRQFKHRFKDNLMVLKCQSLNQSNTKARLLLVGITSSSMILEAKMSILRLLSGKKLMALFKLPVLSRFKPKKRLKKDQRDWWEDGLIMLMLLQKKKLSSKAGKNKLLHKKMEISLDANLFQSRPNIKLLLVTTIILFMTLEIVDYLQQLSGRN